MKKISMSQFKSKIRQIEQKQRTAINNYNRAVRQYNTQVKRAVNEYNSAVRRHNANVLHNRQIIQRGLSRLRSGSCSYKITYTKYIASIENIQTCYNKIVSKYPEGVVVDEHQDYVLDLIEKENAQAVETANKFLENTDQEIGDVENKEIENRLSEVSIDLMNRWKGAIFSLNPQNPDAARHFCTSTRELFTDFIELKASDDSVFAYNPNAQKTARGNATRKEKIKYMMRGYNFDNCVAEFIDADIENILELFHVLSAATHGEAGRYEYAKLIQVKKRVEQGINFLCKINA